MDQTQWIKLDWSNPMAQAQWIKPNVSSLIKNDQDIPVWALGM